MEHFNFKKLSSTILLNFAWFISFDSMQRSCGWLVGAMLFTASAHLSQMLTHRLPELQIKLYCETEQTTNSVLCMTKNVRHFIQEEVGNFYIGNVPHILTLLYEYLSFGLHLTHVHNRTSSHIHFYLMERVGSSSELLPTFWDNFKACKFQIVNGDAIHCISP